MLKFTFASQELTRNSHPVEVAERKDEISLENSFVRAVFRIQNNTCNLVSFFDKRSNHEAISHVNDVDGSEAYGNQFVLFEDVPMNWDAW